MFEVATGDYPPSSPVPASVVAKQSRAVDGTLDRLDPVLNDVRLASLISTARLTLYPDAGHTFLFQVETAFVPVVEAFLAAR